MDEIDAKRRNDGTSIRAGGDVIGVNVIGDKNIIGKNMHVSQTSTDINQIAISQQVLSKLDTQYANAFKQVTESLNNQIMESRDVKSEQVATIQNSLEDLVKETEGVKSGEQLPEQKKKSWKEKFKIFAKHAINALPKTAATLALFTPLTAAFSKQIEDGLQSVVEGIQAAME